MSSWKTSKYRLTGVCGIIFHNGQLANPMNWFAREMKKISGKKKKTDADLERLAELEFKGSLYVDEQQRPIMPTEGIEAIIVAGAKKSKEGNLAKAGVFCTKPALLEYDGPPDATGLWQDKRFVIAANAKVNMSRVVRTRPIFPQWSCQIEVQFNTEMCNEEQVYNWLRVAGEQCGAFDWRPKYGRFTVERIE